MAPGETSTSTNRCMTTPQTFKSRLSHRFTPKRFTPYGRTPQSRRISTAVPTTRGTGLEYGRVIATFLKDRDRTKIMKIVGKLGTSLSLGFP